MFYLEEKSVEGRDLSKDVGIFKKSCDRLRGVMEKIKAIKDSGNAAEAVSHPTIAIVGLVALLRCRFCISAVLRSFKMLSENKDSSDEKNWYA